jgi:hypothetical protein
MCISEGLPHVFSLACSPIVYSNIYICFLRQFLLHHHLPILGKFSAKYTTLPLLHSVHITHSSPTHSSTIFYYNSFFSNSFFYYFLLSINLYIFYGISYGIFKLFMEYMHFFFVTKWNICMLLNICFFGRFIDYVCSYSYTS